MASITFPTAYPAAQASLQAGLNSAAANLAALEAAGAQAGVDYSIDGESYQWAQAKKYYQDAIVFYQRQIQALDGPWMLRSVGRP